MFALMVKDNGGYNPFGYNVWNGFQQVNNDELQKVVVSAKFSTPSIGIKGFENNEKSIQAFFYTTIDFAYKETLRINKILKENEQPQYDFIIIDAVDLSKKINAYI